MNVFNFSDESDSTKKYPYKILVYPNITWSKNLSQDSGIVVINNIISNLESIRSDIHWTILLPEKLDIFSNKNNIDQILYSLPTYPNQMRCHLDSSEFLAAIDWRNRDFDIVYSHLPEHTLQLKNLLFNTTNIRPEFIGYTHWTEFPEITEYPMTLIDHNFLGILEMNACGINTIAQKNLVLKNAEKHFNSTVTKKLSEKLVPQYLGWEIPEYEKRTRDTKTIVFNHRPHEYKNYPWFLDQMDIIFSELGDMFKVWVPLAEKADREYIIVGNNENRKEYLSNLSSCYIGVCGEQKYSGWSISATDGMSVGVPYLFSNDDSYHELASDAGIYYFTDEDFREKIKSFITDNTDEKRNNWSKMALERFEESKWKFTIKPFNVMIQSTIDNLPQLRSDTESYNKIVKFIQQNVSVSKREILDYMGWGVRIAFSTYRNRLRSDPGIVFTTDRYEYNEEPVSNEKH